MQLDSDADSGYESEGESYDEEEVEVVVLSDDYPNDMQMVAPAMDTKEGDKNLPIDVDKLPEVADLPEAVVVKQEVQEEVVARWGRGAARPARVAGGSGGRDGGTSGAGAAARPT